MILQLITDRETSDYSTHSIRFQSDANELEIGEIPSVFPNPRNLESARILARRVPRKDFKWIAGSRNEQKKNQATDTT